MSGDFSRHGEKNRRSDFSRQRERGRRKEAKIFRIGKREEEKGRGRRQRSLESSAAGRLSIAIPQRSAAQGLGFRSGWWYFCEEWSGTRGFSEVFLGVRARRAPLPAGIRTDRGGTGGVAARFGWRNCGPGAGGHGAVVSLVDPGLLPPGWGSC